MDTKRDNPVKESWSEYVERYRGGEWRAPIFHDMILEDAHRLKNSRQSDRDLTFIDIGCGGGFDNDPVLQESLSKAAGRYIGIEPDSNIEPGDHIHEIHRCTFEKAPIEPSSIDIAFSLMVMEHIPDPEIFWRKIREILVDGGIYWGFTVDSRHYFCTISKLTERLGLKDRYLTLVQGDRGDDRYENYPTCYLANNPAMISKYTRDFSRVDFISFSRIGQLDFYYPRWLHPLSHLIDWITIAARSPGPVLAIRIEK